MIKMMKNSIQKFREYREKSRNHDQNIIDKMLIVLYSPEDPQAQCSTRTGMSRDVERLWLDDKDLGPISQETCWGIIKIQAFAVEARSRGYLQIFSATSVFGDGTYMVRLTENGLNRAKEAYEKNRKQCWVPAKPVKGTIC